MYTILGGSKCYKAKIKLMWIDFAAFTDQIEKSAETAELCILCQLFFLKVSKEWSLRNNFLLKVKNKSIWDIELPLTICKKRYLKN